MKLMIGVKMATFVSLVLIFALGLACTQASPTPTPTIPPKSASYTNPDLLVETDWLADHLDDANLRVVDVRAADKYQGGHVRNAVNLPASDAKGPLYDQAAAVK